ncbi:hypothetical protein KKF70_06725 [bacterium]|nr:hypothetical protein [bacterium]MBU2529059.1 hypothetical protein [bacterium]
MKYEVKLERDKRESAVITVDAKDEDDASEKALDIAGPYGSCVDFDNEGSCPRVYVSDIEELG